jgi:hypothetical protein
VRCGAFTSVEHLWATLDGLVWLGLGFRVWDLLVWLVLHHRIQIRQQFRMEIESCCWKCVLVCARVPAVIHGAGGVCLANRPRGVFRAGRG